ncbi:MAG: RNA pyrophosphohydrolase [Akkermansiaceae bacterium]
MKSNDIKMGVMARYRPNVAVLMINREGKLLICERINSSGAWQFPQGGVDPGEELEAALVREVKEEIGLSRKSYKILENKEGYRYFYSKPVRKNGRIYDGQEQTYFLCRLRKKAREINIDQKNPEFGDYQWIQPEDFKLEWLPSFKREVYRAVMLDFFDVGL